MKLQCRIQPLMILIVGLLIVCFMGAFALWDNLLVRKGVISALLNEARLVGQEFAFGVDMRHEADRLISNNGSAKIRPTDFNHEIAALKREMHAVITLRHNVTRLDLLTRHEDLPRLLSSSDARLTLQETEAHRRVFSGTLEWTSIPEVRNRKDYLYVVVPFYHRNRRLGTVGVRVSLYEANTLVRLELERRMILLLIEFTLLAGALSLIIRRLILNPVYQMSEAMNRVGEGNLDTKLQLKGSLEVHHLAESFNAMVRMLKDRTTEIAHLLKTVRDLNDSLTQRVESATRELIQKNASLEDAGREMFFLQRKLSEMERVAAIGEGLAIVAHELGNPLHSISGHVELSLEEPGLSQGVVNHLKIVQGQLDRMINVIRKFLMISRREPNRNESISIPSLVSDMLQLLAPRLEKTGIRVRIRFPETCPLIESDKDGLQSVLINFLENALDATGPGGTIDIRGDADVEFLTLHIQDNGPGIPVESRGRIFEPFYTTKPHGTGLGLAICRKIIDDLGGEVRLGDGPGGHFLIKIPLVRSSRLVSQSLSLEHNP